MMSWKKQDYISDLMKVYNPNSFAVTVARKQAEELNILRTRLSELEWIAVPGCDICPVCSGERKHNSECWLANELIKQL